VQRRRDECLVEQRALVGEVVPAAASDSRAGLKVDDVLRAYVRRVRKCVRVRVRACGRGCRGVTRGVRGVCVCRRVHARDMQHSTNR
jgi:hypothetical protein